MYQILSDSLLSSYLSLCRLLQGLECSRHSSKFAQKFVIQSVSSLNFLLTNFTISVSYITANFKRWWTQEKALERLIHLKWSLVLYLMVFSDYLRVYLKICKSVKLLLTLIFYMINFFAKFYNVVEGF